MMERYIHEEEMNAWRDDEWKQNATGVFEHKENEKGKDSDKPRLKKTKHHPHINNFTTTLYLPR